MRQREVTQADLDLDNVLVVVGLLFWIPLMLLWYAQGSPLRNDRRRFSAPPRVG